MYNYSIYICILKNPKKHIDKNHSNRIFTDSP